MAADPSAISSSLVAGGNTYLVDVALEPAIPVDRPVAFQSLQGLLVVLDVPLIPLVLLQLLDAEQVLQLLIPGLELLDALLQLTAQGRVVECAAGKLL